VLDYLKACYHEDAGGFSPTPRHDPQLLTTLSAVQIAVTLDAVDCLDKDAIVKYITSLQVNVKFCSIWSKNLLYANMVLFVARRWQLCGRPVG
jgi:prenyltransferase beta subunit